VPQRREILTFHFEHFDGTHADVPAIGARGRPIVYLWVAEDVSSHVLYQGDARGAVFPVRLLMNPRKDGPSEDDNHVFS